MQSHSRPRAAWPHWAFNRNETRPLYSSYFHVCASFTATPFQLLCLAQIIERTHRDRERVEKKERSHDRTIGELSRRGGGVDRPGRERGEGGREMNDACHSSLGTVNPLSACNASLLAHNLRRSVFCAEGSREVCLLETPQAARRGISRPETFSMLLP